jgi:hypothetical protein
MRTRVVVICLAVAAFASACGGATSGSERSSGTPQTSDSGAQDGAPTGVHALVAACPAVAPTHGSACTTLVSCEYGADPNFTCNLIATCDISHRWYVHAPSCKYPTPTTDASCPAQRPASGDPCTKLGSVCDFPEGRCGCIDSSSPAGFAPDAAPPPAPKWSCAAPPPPGSGCPATRPFNGEPCARPPNGMSCDYGASCVEGSVMMQCYDGSWAGDTATPCGGA